MHSESLQSDRATCDVLRRLFFSESKSGLLPTDLNLLTYLVLRKSIDHEIDDSAGTLAQRLSVERKAVQRSITRLEAANWITVNSRGVGRSNSLALNFEKFPAGQPLREKITESAKAIAREYANELQKAGRRRLPKNWVTRQYPSAQRFIDRCGGDAKRARDMVAVGFNHRELQKRVRTSLYHACLVFPKLERAYESRIAEIAEQKRGTKSEHTEIRRNETA